jgi:hypothetical protein
VSAWQEQIHSSLEAQRHIRIVSFDVGTATTIPVRGLRPAFLRLHPCDRLNPIEHCSVALALSGAVVFVPATNASLQCDVPKSPGFGTALPNLHFFMIEAEHIFKGAPIQQAPLRWIAGLPQPPRYVRSAVAPNPSAHARQSQIPRSRWMKATSGQAGSIRHRRRVRSSGDGG